jgi:L,D-peptidoglycan transpeptidase YkuD (ErfK/YbiS/YcfS/YnhG family)
MGPPCDVELAANSGWSTYRMAAAGRAKRVMKRTTVRVLRVRRLVGDGTRGHLLVGSSVIPCALGRAGIVQRKREGDGGSPRGTFRLRGAVYRPDRFGARPRTALSLHPTKAHDGWCDDPRDRRYNRPVSLPLPGVSAEEMWRQDGLYDVVVDLDWNRGPIRPGRGSAIFMHVARPGYRPTEGCVALARSDLLRLLRKLGPKSIICIG